MVAIAKQRFTGFFRASRDDLLRKNIGRAGLFDYARESF
jgi:hypothetical protein